jgi:hypothetical protein
MNQALYAHMTNKRKMKTKQNKTKQNKKKNKITAVTDAALIIYLCHHYIHIVNHAISFKNVVTC